MEQKIKILLEKEYQDKVTPRRLRKKTLESIERLSVVKSLLELFIIIPIVFIHNIFKGK